MFNHKIAAFAAFAALATGCDVVQKKDLDVEVAMLATKAEIADVVRRGNMPDMSLYAKTADLDSYVETGELTKLATAEEVEALRKQLTATTTTATAALALARSNETAVSALNAEIMRAQADLKGLRDETNAQWIHLKRQRLTDERVEGNLTIVRERVETNERNIGFIANPDQGKVDWKPMKRANARMRRRIACEQAGCAAK